VDSVARSTKRSMKTVPSPNADFASLTARSNWSLNSECSRTTRMPRPPPPIAALMMTKRESVHIKVAEIARRTGEAVLLNERVGICPRIDGPRGTGHNRDSDLHG
jgi:hypothetical protein